MADIIEIHSCSIEKSTMSFPMGALCIKTAINNDNSLPKAVLFNHYISDDAVNEAVLCAERCPKAVGVSVYIWNQEWFEAFCSALHKQNPNIIVFAGGPACLQINNKNFAITGEGEVTVVSCLKRLFSGEALSGVFKGELPNLEKLPSVFLSHQADSVLEGTDSVLWEMTRGCPYACSFCYESRGNRLVRKFPMTRIEQELCYLTSHNVSNVFVLDPTFNLDKERAKQILLFLIENAPHDMHFTFEIRAELVDAELAQMFATLNCSLQIGLQSCSESVLGNVNRHFNKNEFSNHVKLLCKSGAAYGFDIIIGLPGDTLDGFKESVNYAVSLMPSNIDCFTLCLLPNTELEEKKVVLGYKWKNDREKTIISSPTFSVENISQALEIKNAMDLFYTKGQAAMWIHCILETLNISACNLFLLFAKWLEQTNRSTQEDIWILQDDFVSSLFEKTQNTKLLGALKSFMELHQAICFVTDTGESVNINLTYSPDDLAQLDSTSLSEFVKTTKIYRCSLVVELDENGEISFRQG